MKVRESAMPDEAYWESLMDPEGTLTAFSLNETVSDIAEVGCGYGTFTIPSARRIKGTVTALEIEPDLVARTCNRAFEAKLSNVRAIIRDVFCNGLGLPEGSQDMCLLFNILHTDNPVYLLSEAAFVVRPGGYVLVTHWQYDETTPRGPSLSIRPRPEDILRWAGETNMLESKSPIIDLKPYHYGIRLRRLP